MQPKFYADENIPLAVSKALKKRGIDVLTVQESEMLQKDDNVQLSFAVKEKRAVITHDSDFLKLVAKEKINHYGILFFTKHVSINKAIEEIEQIYLAFSSEDLQGAVLFLLQ